MRLRLFDTGLGKNVSKSKPASLYIYRIRRNKRTVRSKSYKKIF